MKAEERSQDGAAGEDPSRFERRKADHIRLALDDRTEARGGSGLDRIRLEHEALPELDFDEIDLSAECFGRKFASPMFVSSMTAGHSESTPLNRTMAEACERRNWPMGVGSQRKQLFDRSAAAEWAEIRKACPQVALFGNIGLAQLIKTTTEDIRRLADSLQATAMIVHTNALQEALQPEGTPQLRGGLKALERLARELDTPIVVKETGCGFSRATLERLRGIGVEALDVSGFGGTHWGRIEGGRSEPESILAQAAETFRDWGIGTVESLLAAVAVKPDYAIWASGGVRSGLDAAKLAAMGARMVGFARPIIEAALEGQRLLDERMARFELEMRIAMFCSGARTLAELRERELWRRV